MTYNVFGGTLNPTLPCIVFVIQYTGGLSVYYVVNFFDIWVIVVKIYQTDCTFVCCGYVQEY